MSNPERRLTLDPIPHRATLIPNVRRTRRDMTAIFGPKRFPSSLGTLIGLLRLTPGEDDPRPDFKLTAIRSYRGEGRLLYVEMGNVSLPGRAAGWAALRMYCDKMGQPLQQLYAVDANPATEAVSETAHFDKGSFFTNNNVMMYQNSRGKTAVQANNPNRGSLIDLMQNLNDEYSFIYDEAGTEEISAAIGGLVGATDFAAFREAWQDAHASQGSPVDSARALLNSGVFLD